MKKNIMAIIWSFIIMVGIEANIVQASSVQIADQTLEIEKEYENSVRSEIIGWRYKTVNGILYRRLFNYTRNEWIGKWEKV